MLISHVLLERLCSAQWPFARYSQGIVWSGGQQKMMTQKVPGEATLRQQYPGSGDRGGGRSARIPPRKRFLTGILANTLPALPSVLQ